MEHLLLEVAAAPLRLIAAKNEKSRSELGRFLAKQVRARARGGCPAAPRRCPRPCPAPLPGERRAASCPSGSLLRAGPWRRRPRGRRGRKEPLFFIWGKPPLAFSTDFPHAALSAPCGRRGFGKKGVGFFFCKRGGSLPFCRACYFGVPGQPPLFMGMNVFLFRPVHSLGHFDKY